MTSLSQVALDQLNKMAKDWRYFARNCVKIEGVNPGEVCALEFNDAQNILHLAATVMLQEVGFVRIIILKGRQQGISTYVVLRLFWKTYFVPNTKVCVISHEAKSSKALFDKVAFALNNLPEPFKIKPLTDNRTELELPNGSKYVVLTAGSKESGRSQTAHHQHQSERAFFENAGLIDAGAGQIVADAPGTEIYKESTANGWNHFRQECLDALAGTGLYRLVFIPWYLEKRYRHKVKPGFKPDEEEMILAELYGLDHEQLQWRRNKIAELGVRKFKQEYPFTIMEAFQKAEGAFFDAILIEKARRSTIKGQGAVVLGVDPARTGDRTVIALRIGREVVKLWKYNTMDSDRLANILAGIIREYDVTKCFIDWAKGDGTIDQLRKLGFHGIVEGINFGQGADNDLYLNKRAEMAFKLRDWMADGEVNLPDDPDMEADFGSMPDYEETNHGKIKFKEKKEIKKEYGRSPDILDAIMLTFARPVRDSKFQERNTTHVVNVQKGSSLSTMRRFRSGEF
jgi:hypothetical protein